MALKKWIILLALVPRAALANDFELIDLFEDPRSLGLGRAITSYVDDYSSVYHNPAGLGLISKWNVKSFLSFDAGLNVVGIMSDAKDAFAQASTGGNAAYQSALQILEPYKNKKTFGRGDLGVFWTWADGPFFLDHIAIGMYWQFVSNSMFHESLNTLDVDLMSDAHVVIGKAFSFFSDDSLRLGVSTKLGYRTNLSTTADLLLAFVNQDGSNPIRVNSDTVTERVWTDIDAGIQYDLPFLKRFRPRVGAAFLNLLNQYSLLAPELIRSNTTNAVRVYERHINVGVSTAFPAFLIFEPNLIIDIKNLGIRTESFWLRVHAGLELRLLLFDWWQGSIRMGFDQGNFTVGGFGLLGTKGMKWTIDMVYYGREMGTFPGQNVDHRFLIQLGFII